MADLATCPLVSVVVPVYNVEKYLERCVHSILNQSYPCLEIILVDDGSTDSSGKICEDLKQQDKRIVVIHTDNRGVSHARNMGTKHVTGRYLAYVDADDLLGKNHILSLLSSIVATDANIALTGSTYILNNDSLPQPRPVAPSNYELLSSMETVNRALSPSNSPFAEQPWGKLFSVSLIPFLQFPENKYFEDVFIMYRVMLEANKIIYEDANDYYYTVGRLSSTMNQHNEKHLDHLEARESMLEYARNNSLPELEAVATMRYYSGIIGELAGFSLAGNSHLTNLVYNKVRAERSEAFLSPYTAISTKIAFALSFLPKKTFLSILQWNQRKIFEKDQLLTQQTLDGLKQNS